MGEAPQAGKIRIGISGWRYAGWRGQFYPKGLAQRRELESSDFAYLRLHGSERLYLSGYEADGIEVWAQRVVSFATGMRRRCGMREHQFKTVGPAMFASTSITTRREGHQWMPKLWSEG